MNVQRKFHWDSLVEVCGEGIERLPQFKDLIGKRLVVDAVQWYHSKNYREDATTDSYYVFPEEYKGMEHDEGKWIGGCNLRLVA